MKNPRYNGEGVQKMNGWKIASIVCTVMIFVCFIGFAVLGMTGYGFSGGGFSPWVIVAFVGFGVFGFLSALFNKFSKNESPLDNGPSGSPQGYDSLSKKEVVKVRCPHCGALNDEDADFCNKCGGRMK